MAVYSNIDLETFKWVRREVESTLRAAEEDLQSYASNDDKSVLYGLGTQLHQVVGSLQMLEMKSVSALIIECERLIEDVSSADIKIAKSSFVVMLEDSFKALQNTFQRIENGLPENPIDVVELINQIRALRGLDDIEISSLFSPMIEIFPEIDSSKALKDEEYKRRATALRAHYQSFLLNWLRSTDAGAIDKIGMIFDKLYAMSAFGAVARLWWVATAYTDYVKHNDLNNKSVHSRIFRQLDDRFRELEQAGESALVRDPGDELVKIMLFYTGVGEKRTERMDKIVNAFKLHEYFPALDFQTEVVDYAQLEIELSKLKTEHDLPLPLIRQLVSAYFEDEQGDAASLAEVSTQIQSVHHKMKGRNLSVIDEVMTQVLAVLDGIEKGAVKRDDDTSFHIASALMFVEGTLMNPAGCDDDWLQNRTAKSSCLSSFK